MKTKYKFGIVGLGFISPKHIEAIKKVGGEIVSTCDNNPRNVMTPSEAYFYDDFKEFIEKTPADFISICTPNYLHTEMILEAAKRGKTIICEKPMTFTLQEIELLKGVPKLFGMFQLRYLPELGDMRREARQAVEVSMNVEMKRSKTYHESWKGDPTKTGGLLMNIGCHYFDLIGHLFGYTDFTSVSDIQDTQATGVLDYGNVKVNWRIAFTEEQESYDRSITINGRKFDLVQKENLHIRAYEDLMWCRGMTASEEEKIIKMIDKICTT